MTSVATETRESEITLPKLNFISVGVEPNKGERNFVTHSVFQVMSELIRQARTDENTPDIQVGALICETNPSGKWFEDANFAVMRMSQLEGDVPQTTEDAIDIMPYFNPDAISGLLEAIDRVSIDYPDSKFGYACTWQAIGVATFGVNPQTTVVKEHASGRKSNIKLPEQCAMLRMVFDSGHQVTVLWDQDGNSVLTLTSVDLTLSDQFVIRAPRVVIPRNQHKVVMAPRLLDSEGIDPIVQLRFLHGGVEEVARTAQ